MAGFPDWVASDCKRQSGINERVPQFFADLAGDIVRDKVVLADGHVRPVLLGASDVNDRSVFSLCDCALNLRPREIFYVE